jgi:hypothetical protein
MSIGKVTGFIKLFIYFWGWMGPTDTEATKQPIVPALDNRL